MHRHRAVMTATTRHSTQRGGARPASSRRTAAARSGPPPPPSARPRAPNRPSSRSAPMRRSEQKLRRRRRQRRRRRPPSRREVVSAARRAWRGCRRATPLRSLSKQPLRGRARAQASERCVDGGCRSGRARRALRRRLPPPRCRCTFQMPTPSPAHMGTRNPAHNRHTYTGVSCRGCAPERKNKRRRARW